MTFSTIMTGRFFSFAVAALMAVCASAQNYSVIDEVKSDWGKSSGMEGPYRFESTTLTPAPKGYKPIHISHYGRHGSRYAWKSGTYTIILKALTQAREEGKLTPYGKDFLSRYEDFYFEPLLNTGDLVDLGTRQHARIAQEMYDNFPSVFKSRKNVVARSSTAQRCILSMASFTTALAQKNPSLSFSLASTHLGMREVVPPSAPSQVKRTFTGKDYSDMNFESVNSFWERTVNCEEILSKFFTDSSFIEEYAEGKLGFIKDLFMFLGGYQNYADVSLFQDAVTVEEYAAMWEASNYASFTADLQARYNMIPLLEDIIVRADDAICGNGVAADLRFGHDYIVEAFCCLLNLNNCGAIPATADEVKYWFQSYNITMATTLLFVFYQGKKSDDVLFKVLWNGKEATLPDLQAVSGPYYRWSDFKSFAEGIFLQHPEK